MNRLTIAGLAAALLLGACTTDPYTGEQKVSNTAIGAAGGALLGGLAGAAIRSDSSRDARKGALIGAGIGALAGGGIGLYMDNQEAALRQRLQNSGVGVTRVGDSIVLIMPGNITFATDRADIRPEFNEVLDSVAAVLSEFNQSLVDVNGHTDSDGSEDYNLQLSRDRAESVGLFLVNRGMNSQRIAINGFGESQPAAPNSSAAGKAQNRRVEIEIVPLT
jgi:outer membrane protein OmpA-like peptidoglycan-associated protein